MNNEEWKVVRKKLTRRRVNDIINSRGEQHEKNVQQRIQSKCV